LEGNNLRKFRFIGILVAFAFVVSFIGLPKESYAATVSKKIEVNKTTNYLYLYENGKVVKTYRISTGKTKELTPEGTFPLVVKINGPSWKNVPPGPNNPLGPRWNGISVNGDNGRSYGIHGTNQPNSIGTHASNGCIRMLNNQVIELSNLIYEGVPVWIHTGKSNGIWRGDMSVGLKPAAGKVKTTKNATAWTGPSTGSFKITTVAKNTTLTRTGTSGNYTQVKLSNGRKGFIYNGDLDSGLTFKPESGYAEVTVDNANVRKSPNLSSPVVEKAKKGSHYLLLADNGEWYRVKTASGKVAYISHLVAKKWVVTVTSSTANVRAAASMNAPIIAKVSKGTVLTKLGVSGEFHKIRLNNGTVAYIHKTVAK
jgi:uncharacterized protein YgiM (DUF1202 family)